MNEGKYREAVECFQRAIDVTPKMARDLIQACRDRNVDCIVAPYEGIVTKLRSGSFRLYSTTLKSFV